MPVYGHPAMKILHTLPIQSLASCLRKMSPGYRLQWGYRTSSLMDSIEIQSEYTSIKTVTGIYNHKHENVPNNHSNIAMSIHH